jgi:hypothetical protein
VHEHVLTAVIANDETESLLRIEEFDDAFAFANDLRGHSATASATAAEATATAATAAEAASTAAAEAATVAVATAASAAAAEAAAITITSAAASAAAEAASLLETATEITRESFFAEAFALIATASTAVSFAPSIETHIRPNLICPLTPETNALGQKGATGHARNSLTHRSHHYSKNRSCSSDSNCSEIRRGWQGGWLGD